MQSGYRPTPITSKFVAIYTKLFQGVPPARLDSKGDAEHLFSELPDLQVDRGFLFTELDCLSKEACIGSFKPLLNSTFRSCLDHASKTKYGDVKKAHAIETLSIVVRSCLAKNPSGWEVMEMLTGSVGQSDRVFNDFTTMLNDLIGDEKGPEDIRHLALQLGLVFMCSVSQLSPGAYFLRRNLFPSIISFIKSPETEQHAFEAVLFLAILANYHKSDAAKLNPYLKRIKECEDEQVMRRIVWAVNDALCSTVKTYESSCSGGSSALNLATSFGSALSFLRPDRLLARISQNTTTENAEKQQPIEAAVALLPLFEFTRGNPHFACIFLEGINKDDIVPSTSSQSAIPLPCTLLSLVSHLFAHASSSSSPRSTSYANLALDTLLVLVEQNKSMETLSTRSAEGVNLCRQRLPRLPMPQPGRRLLCDVLDCCNLWLRHNLNQRLPVHLYAKCIWICHRIIWYLQAQRIRLEYEWKELWISVFGLLSFLASKFDSLITTGGIEHLVTDTLAFLEIAVACSETYLPSPHALYELIYELVRNAPALEKQQALLDSLTFHDPGSAPRSPRNEALRYTMDVTFFYKEKIVSKGATNAPDAMKVVVQELELDGLHGGRAAHDLEPPLRSEGLRLCD